MEEQLISARVQEIIDAYAILPQMNDCDLSLEPLENGDVNVEITYKYKTSKEARAVGRKLIKYKDSLDFIPDTFNFVPTVGLNSIPISPVGLKKLFFDQLGDLVTIREDHTEEHFRINPKHREAITAKLKAAFDKKFKE